MAGVMAGAAAATAIVAATGFAALPRDEALIPTVLGAALSAAHAAIQAAHVETVELHAVIPAVREADRVAVMRVALAVEAAMRAALAVEAAMLVVAADMAAAGIGKLL